MSALGDAFGARLTGRAQRPEEFRAWMNELREREGSVTAAARAAGVHRTTWQRWQNGKIGTPKQDTVERLATVTRSGRLVTNRPTNSTFRVTTVGNDGRTRNLGADNLKLKPGTMARVERAYIEGGQERAAAEFRNGIGDPFYRKYMTEPELDMDDLAYEGYILDDDYCAGSFAIA